jgi:hypothetical protein
MLVKYQRSTNFFVRLADGTWLDVVAMFILTPYAKLEA